MRAALGVAVVLSAAFNFSAFAVEPGEQAKAFTLRTQGDAQVSLSDFSGKVVYLDFWASWCPPCRESFPWLTKIQEKYGKDKLQVIAVNVDKKQKDADRFIAELNPGFLIAFDPQGATPADYNVPGMPTSYLIGPDGKIISVHKGFKEETPAQVEQEIAALLGEKI
jgi:cytochrome c biogenesis protein CcmG, thiol:disulfide interchange protein DsbE